MSTATSSSTPMTVPRPYLSWFTRSCRVKRSTGGSGLGLLKGLVGRCRRVTPREGFIIYPVCAYLADRRTHPFRQVCEPAGPAELSIEIIHQERDSVDGPADPASTSRGNTTRRKRTVPARRQPARLATIPRTVRACKILPRFKRRVDGVEDRRVAVSRVVADFKRTLPANPAPATPRSSSGPRHQPNARRPPGNLVTDRRCGRGGVTLS